MKDRGFNNNYKLVKVGHRKYKKVYLEPEYRSKPKRNPIQRSWMDDEGNIFTEEVKPKPKPEDE